MHLLHVLEQMEWPTDYELVKEEVHTITGVKPKKTFRQKSARLTELNAYFESLF